MIVLLHGSGRDGRSLLETWESLAKKEGIVLVGPDALTREGWGIPDDGPDFLHELIEVLAYQLDIDKRRIYLFGFAAVTIHAGALPDSARPLIERAPRKTPIAMWVGTADPLFPLKVVRATRDALKAHGFAPELTEIPGHTHWYYSSAGDINKKVWAFLQQHVLPGEPKYERYTFSR
jgi:predicted esterase